MKRGLAAPLLFLGLALSAKGSVEASPWLWASAIFTLGAAFFSLPASGTGRAFTPLTAAVVFLAAWIAVTNQWANPSYTAAAPYHAAFLLGGFFFGRRAGSRNALALFGAALAFAVVLGGWALWQRGHGMERAHAFFETPATLAAAINLVLLPGLVLVVWGKRRVLFVVGLVVLAAALVSAASRGGWLALTVTSLIALILGRHLGFRIDRRATITLALSFCAGWALSATASLIGDLTAASSITAGHEHSFLAGGAVDSSTDRLGIYELASRSLAASSLFAGAGYLAFYYVMETGRAAVSNIQPGITYFVHNDYLQTLLELGIPGLAALLALVFLPVIMAWRAAPRIAADRRKSLLLLAAVASLASMGTHALVDFPFYIPVCLLMYGIGLGLLDAVLARPASADADDGGRHDGFATLRRALGAGIGVLVVWLLALPVAAEVSGAYAHRQWNAAQSQSAAYWFEIARRLAPRDWRYHWYAGQFWFTQAAQSRKPEAARLADRAFADGDAANPREARNLLGRIATHVQLRALLAAPADGVTLITWAERAVRLAPSDVYAQAERARVLKQFGSARAERVQ